MHAFSQSTDVNGGVGIAFQQYQGWVMVNALMPGSPAARAGIEPGDLLVTIDGRDARNVPFESLPSLIGGPVGTTVVLAISRRGSPPQPVTLQRAALQRPSPSSNVPAPAVPSTPPPAAPRTPPFNVVRESGPGPQTPKPATTGMVKLTRYALRDPAAQNLEAFIFPLPEGWRADGQVVWQHDHTILTNFRVRVSDPKSGTVVEYLPCDNFIWFPPMLSIEPGQNYQGKIYLQPIFDPAQFVQTFWAPQVLPHLQQLRPVSVKELPELGAEFLRLFAGPGEAHAYRLRYDYQVQGQAWEEDVQLGLLFAGSNQLMSWYVNFAVAIRAPKGQLDRMAPLTSAIVGNATASPEWSAYRQIVLKHFYQGLQQQMRDTVAFGQKLAQYRSEMDQVRQQVVADRQASQDRIAGYRRETLGGVETYQDPLQNYPVELPAGYNGYWVNPQGEYLLSEQAGFNPNDGGQGNWQRLERRVPGGR